MVRMPWQENNVYFFLYNSIWTEMLSIIRKGVEKKDYFELKKHCPVGIIRRRLYDVFVPRQLNNSTQFKRQKLCASTMRTHCH